MAPANMGGNVSAGKGRGAQGKGPKSRENGDTGTLYRFSIKDTGDMERATLPFVAGNLLLTCGFGDAEREVAALRVSGGRVGREWVVSPFAHVTALVGWEWAGQSIASSL